MLSHSPPCASTASAPTRGTSSFRRCSTLLASTFRHGDFSIAVTANGMQPSTEGGSPSTRSSSSRCARLKAITRTSRLDGRRSSGCYTPPRSEESCARELFERIGPRHRRSRSRRAEAVHDPCGERVVSHPLLSSLGRCKDCLPCRTRRRCRGFAGGRGARRRDLDAGATPESIYIFVKVSRATGGLLPLTTKCGVFAAIVGFFGLLSLSGALYVVPSSPPES